MALKAPPRPSPLANPVIREFLDELAEIIAEAILEESPGTQGEPEVPTEDSHTC